MNFNSPLGGFMRNTPMVVKNLIIINVVMFILTSFFHKFMMVNFSLFYFESDFFKPYQFLSHLFMHGGFFHLFFNMYTLWIFGTVIERIWGSKKFFIYFLLTGIGAACLHEFVIYLQVSEVEAAIMSNSYIDGINPRDMYRAIMNTPTVGASGAVYGLLLAYGMMFPNNIMQLMFPPIALKAKWFVIIFGAIELFLGFRNAGDNIAHFAHLGGMLFGVIFILYLKRTNRLYN